MWIKAFVLSTVIAAVCPLARAAEHVTLKNGFELDCVRREAVGDKVRLYFAEKAGTAAGSNYMDVAADSVVRVEMVADLPEPVAEVKAPSAVTLMTVPTKEEMHEMLAHAGAAHNIDEDLLASVVRAESGGQVRAVSRTGAQGLMQLMPGTASAMGVEDAFRPEQNISGGTAYLDLMLTRYHDNVALALAAYNAGPGAVDKYHGVPPFRETRAYVARVIREFNRRKQMAMVAQAR
ncbi:lytic transglycosylase domain-containing protein [Tunturiibacter psychrotolerans]|jgi:Transglycosylase SLT domain|uniref:lytic transglycosylase domain-containing protein n=1 Tax=Tunturiibacter psychrotolerans TaxID=3069686 RepID=UPI003D1F33CA